MEQQNHQRISGSTKRSMIFVAILFDLVAVLAVIVMAVAIIYYLSDKFGWEASMVEEATKEAQEFVTPESAGGVAGRLIVAGASGGWKVLMGSLTFLFLAPIIYTVFSFMSTLFAYLTFTTWFLLKGVNMWSFSNPQRPFVNLLSVIIEMIPFGNLLPAITFMVWRHIKVSQMEDMKKMHEGNKKISNQIADMEKGYA